MKILITGCCGFIGSHLTNYLLESGFSVFGIDLRDDFRALGKCIEHKNFFFIKDDIVTTEKIIEVRPDIVINLAAKVGVRDSLVNTQAYVKTNILGFENVMSQSRLSGVRLVIYASSSSVYGNCNQLPMSENYPVSDVLSPYAFTKLENERWAKMSWDIFGQSSIGLRFFTVYGPNGRKDMMPYKLMKSLIDGTSINKFGSNTERDYTYISDIVKGISKCIDLVNTPGYRVYNLGSNNPISLEDFIIASQKVSKRKAIINQLPYQTGDVDRTWADITKVKEELGWSPEVDLETGLRNLYLSMTSKS